MNLGVLLLYCQEGRGTTFTRDWADKAVGRVAEYYATQSGGREAITYKVFDWVQLAQTEAEWSGLGFGAYATLRPSIEAKIGESLDPFTHILIGIDHSQSSGGVTPGAFTYLAASNFTPSLIAHELGHRFGADDAYLETATGNQIYLDQFSVMGALNVPAVFADPTLVDPSAGMLGQSGPNMCAPTLMQIGWLKENEHGNGTEISGNAVTTSSGVVVEVAALAGAPGPARTGPPLVARYEDLVIEYRVAAADGWDRGLPNPGPGAGGWIVVHRSEKNAPAAILVNSLAARPGTVLVLGEDNPFDLFRAGPVRIAVLSFDANKRTVRLMVRRRAARRSIEGVVYGGVSVGGGGLVWTPGRGFVKVPPHSPLLGVLDGAARMQEVQEMMAVATRRELVGLEAEAADAHRNLQGSVESLSIEPSVSPLGDALSKLVKLSTDSNGHSTEAERQQMEEVRQILAEAVELERQI